jgi:hypothetical protein
VYAANSGLRCVGSSQGVSTSFDQSRTAYIRVERRTSDEKGEQNDAEAPDVDWWGMVRLSEGKLRSTDLSACWNILAQRQRPHLWCDVWQAPTDICQRPLLAGVLDLPHRSESKI